MQTVDSFSFEGKKAVIRVDFNVPLNDQFEITDDTRMRAALPTIRKILNDGGAIILMSHLGRPKKGPEDAFSLRHLVDHLSTLIDRPVQFAGDSRGEQATTAAEQLQAGEVLLLENLRFHAGETAGDEDMARELADLGDIYVNDAFGTAHRAHASTAVIARFAKQACFGYLMAAELESVQQVMERDQKPFTAIIGGAKVSSKISIIENLLDKIDYLIIGGGMAYTFAKAQGGNIGGSLVEEDFLETAREILAKAKQQGVNVLLPADTVAGNAFSNDADQQTVPTGNIPDGWMGMDIGPEAQQAYNTCIQSSKTLLWNGPMGVFEMENFASGTEGVARAVAASTQQGAYSLIGGGDSVAAINQFELADQVSYVSTGGGALLELIEGKDLPGVVAIQSRSTD